MSKNHLPLQTMCSRNYNAATVYIMSLTKKLSTIKRRQWSLNLKVGWKELARHQLPILLAGSKEQIRHQLPILLACSKRLNSRYYFRVHFSQLEISDGNNLLFIHTVSTFLFTRGLQWCLLGFCPLGQTLRAQWSRWCRRDDRCNFLSLEYLKPPVWAFLDKQLLTT